MKTAPVSSKSRLDSCRRAVASRCSFSLKFIFENSVPSLLQVLMSISSSICVTLPSRTQSPKYLDSGAGDGSNMLDPECVCSGGTEAPDPPATVVELPDGTLEPPLVPLEDEDDS